MSAGPLVPVVMLPRFTSYVGAGTYVTPPMEVEGYFRTSLTFWRGPLVGGATLDPFLAYLEESHDANVWTLVLGPYSVPDTSDKLSFVFQKRWFRVRVVLAGDATGVVGITTWMAGTLERRLR